MTNITVIVQIIDYWKFETRPSSLRNFETAILSSLPTEKKSHLNSHQVLDYTLMAIGNDRYMYSLRDALITRNNSLLSITAI